MISKVVSFVDFKTQSLQQTPDPSTGIEISEKQVVLDSFLVSNKEQE